PKTRAFPHVSAPVGRLISFDKRGNGASDAEPIEQAQFGATMEQAAGDLLAVLDASAAERAAIVASTFGAWPSLWFAATHPEPSTCLVLQACAPRLVRGDDYPE